MEITGCPGIFMKDVVSLGRAATFVRGTWHASILFSAKWPRGAGLMGLQRMRAAMSSF